MKSLAGGKGTRSAGHAQRKPSVISKRSLHVHVVYRQVHELHGTLVFPSDGIPSMCSFCSSPLLAAVTVSHLFDIMPQKVAAAVG